jgi:phosphoribosylaminoimidazolecarboxamide formyltransferase/IMP cyclohydrolase
MKALLSVSDKKGLIDFAKVLHAHQIELLASGGTARMLKAAGLPVTAVEDYTQSPEILDGRVKTLHPRVHGGILARAGEADAADLEKIGAGYIDIVVCNLYPFQDTVSQKFVTLDDAIENIDIGGVALLRAAAKNFARVTVVCDPCDYDVVERDLKGDGRVGEQTRQVLALKAFAHTAAYDASIRDYLMGLNAHKTDSPLQTLTLHKVQDLRYGENPHQSATLFSYDNACAGPLGGRLLQGKELSYNNLLDLDAAWRAAVALEGDAVVIVKHLGPCGIAAGKTQPAAFAAALACDPISAFGGVIAFNRKLEAETVRAFGDLFVECVAAPGFDDEALGLLSRRKNCRLLEMGDDSLIEEYEYRGITGGMLRQTADFGDPPNTEPRVVSKAQPNDAQRFVLHFAMTCAQHVKSNAIVLAREFDNGVLATVGIGGGQPNRVDSARIALRRAGDLAKGAVMASDAFFPFADSVSEACAAGVSAIIHPGGSVRDAESVAVADAHDVVMLTTSVRHFRH